MASKTLMAGIGAFVAALVVVAVMFAVFARGEPASDPVTPAPAEGKAGEPVGGGKPLVDVLWRSGGSAKKVKEQPAPGETGETGETEKPQGEDGKQLTD
jgi:hypothetical protein